MMYKRFVVVCFCLIVVVAVQAQERYSFTVDLVNVNNDKVAVELLAPTIKESSIVYHLPKIIPGTYSEDDFGRYVEDLKAFDKRGKKLRVVKTDVNSWKINNANKLYRLSYLVNDTYDDGTTKQVVFEPAGSNIEQGKDYVINNNCFIGYFEGMKAMPYEVNVKHAANLYGSTALKDEDASDTNDKFVVENYNRIVDNPFMYCVPDTTVIKVGNTDVLISVYSPTKQVSSKYLASKLDTLLQAQGKYLGGSLPVDKYAFLIYLDSRKIGYSGGEGALEHSYCSMYYYPERPDSVLAPEFVDHAAHEFFHIITPLTIHSNEIQNFDFNSPKMSRHLWLYEGSTEYHAHMVQEKYGLITPEELLDVFSDKIKLSRLHYNDTVPFTTMSNEVLGRYKNEFGNVYQKGALINLAVDVELLQLSNGKYGIMNLIHDLSNKYGKQKGFEDTALFNEITQLTYPEIKAFLTTYLAGNTPLPYKEIFEKIGVKYEDEVETKDSAFSIGNVTLGINPDNGRLRVIGTSNLNSTGKAAGYKEGDELVSINNVEVNYQSFNKTLDRIFKDAKAGDLFAIKALRKDDAGKEKEVLLEAPLMRVPKYKQYALCFIDQPTQQQLLIRNAWLGK